MDTDFFRLRIASNFLQIPAAIHVRIFPKIYFPENCGLCSAFGIHQNLRNVTLGNLGAAFDVQNVRMHVCMYVCMYVCMHDHNSGLTLTSLTSLPTFATVRPAEVSIRPQREGCHFRGGVINEKTGGIRGILSILEKKCILSA